MEEVSAQEANMRVAAVLYHREAHYCLWYAVLAVTLLGTVASGCVSSQTVSDGSESVPTAIPFPPSVKNDDKDTRLKKDTRQDFARFVQEDDPPNIAGFRRLGRNEQGMPEYVKQLATDVEMTFVLCPASTMHVQNVPAGSDQNPDRASPVAMNAFLIAKYEVTNEQWKSVMGYCPSDSQLSNSPVHSVSWFEAMLFCSRSDLHLPTELEWEYACRAGSRTLFCFGDDERELHKYAVYRYEHGGAYFGPSLRPVGQLLPNAWGVHDMHGNLFEWCADHRAGWEVRSATSLLDRPQFDPPVEQGKPETCPRTLFASIRGGSRTRRYPQCTSYYREWRRALDIVEDVGFRPVFRLPVQTENASDDQE